MTESQDSPPDTIGRRFADHELIVSKTDLKGRITYANNVFLRIADYREEEVLGKPHNIIRHPAMPRAIFHHLWSELKKGHEVFAYVLNLTKAQDHYWVMAHITPTVGANREITGYHSSRRAPTPEAIKVIAPLYGQLRKVELSIEDREKSLKESNALLSSIIAEHGGSYEQFVLSL